MSTVSLSWSRCKRKQTWQPSSRQDEHSIIWMWSIKKLHQVRASPEVRWEPFKEQWCCLVLENHWQDQRLRDIWSQVSVWGLQPDKCDQLLEQCWCDDLREVCQRLEALGRRLEERGFHIWGVHWVLEEWDLEERASLQANYLASRLAL